MVTLYDSGNADEIRNQLQKPGGVVDVVMELYDMHCEYDDNTPKILELH